MRTAGEISGYPATRRSIESPAVQVENSVFSKYASEINVQPRIAASAPLCPFSDRLRLPLVPTGRGFGAQQECLTR